MAPAGLPVVVRVKRKRDLDPVDTIVVEADETPAAKRRARDAALAAELDAVLEGGLSSGPTGSKNARFARARAADAGAGNEALADIPTRPNRRRFRRVQMTLSFADARDDAVVRELARTVAAAASGRKRETPEEPEEPTLSSRAYAELSKSLRLEASRESTRVKRRATSLRRAPPTSETGAADAMVDHFRMYELEAGSGESDATGGPDEGTLMADFLPMVREYLGKDSPAARSSSGAHGGSCSDEFVYDVYVLENEMPTRDGEANRPDEDEPSTSATFAGGTEAACFFDAMDGLEEDDQSDADSQDSNREDAPDADYPDTEDSYSQDEDEDDWGRASLGRRETPGVGGGFGFWPGFGNVRKGGDANDDDDLEYDVDEGDGGFADARATGTYRETAYDPRYDDVAVEDTYY